MKKTILFIFGFIFLKICIGETEYFRLTPEERMAKRPYVANAAKLPLSTVLALSKISSKSIPRLPPVSADERLITCYYDYEPASWRYAVDPTMCTHLMVFGGNIYTNGTITFLSLKATREILQFKQLNPNLKILVTAGGDPSQAFVDPLKTNKLADQILEFIRKSKFDGFDLDWEFGGLSPLKPPFKGMGEFMRILREKFNNETRRLYISAAVGVTLDILYYQYDVPALNQNLDFINLMTYDFYQYLPTQPYTGHNSPLFKRPEEIWILGWLNTAWAAFHWYQEGMDHKKIAVGLPTYGHSYTLLFKFWHTVRAPATGYGVLGRYTSYNQVCNLLKNENYTRVWDNYAKVPYCYKDNQWISYDDLESVAEKAEWIKMHNLGGAMIYNFAYDDALGECDGLTRYPLHKKIFDTLKS